MAKDEHLDTGEYDPETYWNARARSSRGEVYSAVCGFKLDALRNDAMDAIQRRVLRALLRGVALRDEPVLDFGCGVGRMSDFFTDRGARYTGVDVADEMLEIARSRRPELAFRKLDGTTLPFEDCAFALASSITVLHHNPPERQLALIRELVRVLRPGGHLVMMESIRRSARHGFNVFPRSIEGWVEAVTEEASEAGEMELVRFVGSRWSLLADFTGAVAARLGVGSTLPASLDAGLARMGRVVDPYLLPLLPRRHASNAGLILRKRP